MAPVGKLCEPGANAYHQSMPICCERLFCVQALPALHRHRAECLHVALHEMNALKMCDEVLRKYFIENARLNSLITLARLAMTACWCADCARAYQSLTVPGHLCRLLLGDRNRGAARTKWHWGVSLKADSTAGPASLDSA